ncbi:DNA-directed RNA polymerase III subunit, putative [Perkinsus marinus ATCC 50983]|uniref:DNA-directed RNA polymerase n=1 Tax=Perkinsus marinus (strain ATCC 50983 / TXsc) TaxID=423536 RepID=C5LIK5_PERM5|nr:DNA-directed RNA polymerase III subunit, putative [Perkinsus marinus ATCC 50983]EER03408.1 DNA-directed RNA polymerase III subunit, putative [Perkinsus marinus ATCC 50983]|eukprot:XP_002771592.1 DNA-directed RNA polymerase III subunit, putative [Perkinsus marinus ATCC 50983]
MPNVLWQTAQLVNIAKYGMKVRRVLWTRRACLSGRRDGVRILLWILMVYPVERLVKEYIISGVTGEALECYIFVGRIHYCQKLDHMVMDKIHARSTGLVNQLTRQPTEGRIKNAFELSNDASNVLLGRLMLSSDVFTAYVCRRCGSLSESAMSENIVNIRVPFACKLLFQELQAMHICPRLKVESR